MIDYTRYDKYRGLWAAQATDTETCPGTVGEHYRSSDEALADLIEAADGHDISTLLSLIHIPATVTIWQTP